MKLKASDPLPV